MNIVSISIFLFFCCLGFFSISLVNFLKLRKERKRISQIKDELQKTKDYISTVIESMLDTFVFIDAEGKIYITNRAIEELLGYEKGELTGQPIEKIIDSISTKEMQKITNETVHHTFRITYLTKAGERIPMLFTGSIIMDSGSRIKGIIGIGRDMRELEFAQRQFIQREKMAEIGELSAGLAHQLRNPLSVISSTVQYCLAKFHFNEKIKVYLQMVLRNADESEKIIHELLEFARPSKISFQPHQITKIIDLVCRLAETKCKEQGVQLVKNYPRHFLSKVICDRNQIEQVFLNVIFNALEAMPEGGILTIQTGLVPSKKFVYIDFIDTGKGIPGEYLDKIFIPFFTTKPDGIGLGLSVVQNVIVSHQGIVFVKNNEGGGAILTVHLPAPR